MLLAHCVSRAATVTCDSIVPGGTATIGPDKGGQWCHLCREMRTFSKAQASTHTPDKCTAPRVKWQTSVTEQAASAALLGEAFPPGSSRPGLTCSPESKSSTWLSPWQNSPRVTKCHKEQRASTPRSKCGTRTSTTSLTRERVRHPGAWVPPWIHQSRNSGLRAQQSTFNTPSRRF